MSIADCDFHVIISRSAIFFGIRFIISAMCVSPPNALQREGVFWHGVLFLHVVEAVVGSTTRTYHELGCGLVGHAVYAVI